MYTIKDFTTANASSSSGSADTTTTTSSSSIISNIEEYVKWKDEKRQAIEKQSFHKITEEIKKVMVSENPSFIIIPNEITGRGEEAQCIEAMNDFRKRYKLEANNMESIQNCGVF